jgi:hypothetical protein
MLQEYELLKIAQPTLHCEMLRVNTVPLVRIVNFGAIE